MAAPVCLNNHINHSTNQNIMKKITIFLLFSVFTLALVGCGSSSDKAGEADLFPFGDINDKTGYVNLNGKVAIEPQFDFAYMFRDGIALVSVVQDDGKSLFGYVKGNGDYLLKPQYVAATQFNEGLAWVVEDGGYPKAIDTKGNVQLEAKDGLCVCCFSEGLAAAWLSGDLYNPQWGFIDKKGNVVVEPVYREVAWFSDGLAAVKADNRWGFIDAKGNMVIPEKFSHVKSFQNGLAVVSGPSSALWGAIDKAGKTVIPFEYNEMEADGDLFLVKKGDKTGWIDKSGNWVIDAPGCMALPFAGAELAAVKNEDCYWGYINKKGEVVVDFQYVQACPFSNGKAIVSEDDIWMSIIDEKGKKVSVKSSMLYSYGGRRYPQNEVVESLVSAYPSVQNMVHTHCENVK